ncbi:nucleotidyltransferase domain-containing protein [Chlamydiota bacterium]
MQSVIQKKSLRSVKIFWLNARKAIRILKKAAAEYAKDNSAVLKVVLFGSLAQGRAVPGSDADILVVLKNSSKKFMDRISDISSSFQKLDMGVEVFPYTIDEIKKGIPIANNALKNGITLWKR